MNITITESIHILATPERVWDYTQDWTQRAKWDGAVLAAEVLPGEPRVVRIQTTSGPFLLRYKQFDRPVRTSLVMTDGTSRIISGGGGSWSYAPEGRGTRFTQQNTLKISNRILAVLLAWPVRWMLRRSTKVALCNAKRSIEAMNS